jgi:predicted nucleic acid-binding protein
VDGNHLVVSFITELEILSYKNISKTEHQNLIRFLENECIVIDINNSIKLETINIRTRHQLKLPDSIIAATALSMNIPLLSADKAFKKLKEMEIYFYQIP